MDKWKLYKGSLETIVLQLLGEHPRLYGYEITQKVKVLSNGSFEIKEGALYPALHRLEAKGLLEVEAEKIGNRVRKYYKLTTKGRKERLEAKDQLAEYLAIMQKFINPDILPE